jgi:hypothetical protein
MAGFGFKAGTLSVAAAALLLACGGGETPSSSGGGGTGTTSGAGAGGAGGAAAVKEVMCEGSLLLALPEDPAAEGPWPVGARTVTVAGLVTEIWYPAVVGSEAGKDKVLYDLREHLPAADQGKIPDADNPFQPCNCYRDLPLDEAHGPYPQVLFIHGTAAFRSQSATQMAHWASRGFVVVASDHPGIGLADILGGKFGMSDQPGDATKVLDALDAPAGELAFLAGKLAKGKLALSGHSAGGGAIEGFGDRAKVLIPMAAGGVKAGPALGSSLILGAQDDGIVKYSSQQSGYESSPVKKRLVGLSGAGHLAFSDLCAIGADKGGILQVAIDHGVNVNPLIAKLATDGCKAGQLAPEKGWAIINAASSAVLEESLSCSTSAAAKLSAIKATYADVGEYQEAL